MKKNAQERGLYDKYIGDNINKPGEWAENFFDPEFKDVMDDLRDKTDDPVRKLMLGEEGDDSLPLKEVLKEAKSNFKRREYLTSIDFICRFHNRMVAVVKILAEFNGNLDEAHQQFLFKGLNPEQVKYIKKQKEAFVINQNNYFKKIAGLSDIFLDVKDFVMGDERPRALRAWEKRYPGKLKALKRDTVRLLDSSEKLFNTSVLNLKAMSRARSQRKVDDYAQSAMKITKAFEDYNTKFIKFRSDYDKDIFNNAMLFENLPKDQVVDKPQIMTTDSLNAKKSKSKTHAELTEKMRATFDKALIELDIAKINFEKYKGTAHEQSAREGLRLVQEKYNALISKEDAAWIKYQEELSDVLNKDPKSVDIDLGDIEESESPKADTLISEQALPSPNDNLGKINTPITNDIIAFDPNLTSLRDTSKDQKTLIPSGAKTSPRAQTITEDTLIQGLSPYTPPKTLNEETVIQGLKPYSPAARLPAAKPESLTDEEQKEFLNLLPNDKAKKINKKEEKNAKEIETAFNNGTVAVSNHQEFYSNLESLAETHSPAILKQYISKYAKLIRFSDPKTFVYLLNVSKSI